MITASCEYAIDYEETARVATEAFGSRDTTFYPAQFHWFYERCFSRGTTIVALRDGNRKIGHCALVRQPVLMNGVNEPAAQLVDLFILKGVSFKGELAVPLQRNRTSVLCAENTPGARNAERKSAPRQRALFQDAPVAVASYSHGCRRSFPTYSIDLLRRIRAYEYEGCDETLCLLPNAKRRERPSVG